MSRSNSPTSYGRRSRDTGFPEPLDGTRNTTLPHPDADLSPNACITQEDDFSVERAYKRSRRTFLSRRKRTVSHGFLSPQTEAIQSMMSLSLDLSTLDSSEALAEETPKATSPTTTSSARFSKDQDSMLSGKDKHEDTPPSSPEPCEPSRRKGLLSKLRRR